MVNFLATTLKITVTLAIAMGHMIWHQTTDVLLLSLNLIPIFMSDMTNPDICIVSMLVYL